MLRKIQKKNSGGSTRFMRPLTGKEKTLLIILFALLSFYLLFKLVINPQKERLEKLQVEKLELDEKIIENNRILRSEKEIKESWASLNDERDTILEDFFPSLDQAQIVYLLNDLMMAEGIDSTDFRFSKANTETINENEVVKMDVSLPFMGGYKGIYETIRAIENSPRKIVINEISLERRENRLAGNMNLRIYSLEGIADTDKNVIHVETTDDNSSNPFLPYDDYRDPNQDGNENKEEDEAWDKNGWIQEKDNDFQGDDNQVKETGDNSPDQMVDNLVYDFAKGKYEFFSDNPLLQAGISLSDLSKSGTRSINLQYKTHPSDSPNSGYIDMTSNNIALDQDDKDLGLWIYASKQSPGRITMTLRDSKDKEVNIVIADEIDWTNWKFKKIPLAKNAKYPLKLEKILVDFPKENEIYGNFLFDSLIIDSDYFYYRVKPGDTIYGISSKFYKTTKYVGEILKLNKMKAGDILRVGRKLKLKKHN